MAKNDPCAWTQNPSAGLSWRDYHALSHGIYRHVNSSIPRIDFLREILKMLLDYSNCDAIELRVRVMKEDQYYRCKATRPATQPITIEVVKSNCQDENVLPGFGGSEDWVEEICRMIIEKQPLPFPPFYSNGGCFWIGNAKQSLPFVSRTGNAVGKHLSRGMEKYPSLLIVPFGDTKETIGLLLLRSKQKDFFQESAAECYENVAQTVGLALINQLAHASLRERIKELTCLYSLTQLIENPGIQLSEFFQGVVELLPSAWQYPEITVVRISFDGCCYVTSEYQECLHKQCVNLVVNGQQRGSLEAGYTHEKPDLDEGPFLKEERSLIDTVARQIAILIERRETAEEKSRLQDQLRHADRLATIGQLSAGVAHELNEPLGNILAFAQLASKEPGVPEQVFQDLEKIVRTSLHAREIIKKLLLFARQMPLRKMQVKLNTLVEDGFYFLESRCRKDGIIIEQDLAAGLPVIVADPSQLNQVLVNLVVNAIHAMPGGGTLKISTRASGRNAVLSVEDNGIGMTPEVMKQIFIPFFTTKDIHEGAGLGLPVVHGIVTSHGGTVAVKSTPGHGTRFDILLPMATVEEEMEGNFS